MHEMINDKSHVPEEIELRFKRRAGFARSAEPTHFKNVKVHIS